MNEREQIEHLANDVDALVDRYRSEYELSYAAVVGVLQMKCTLLCLEAHDRRDELGGEK